MEKKHLLDYFEYTIDRLEELSASYEEQVNNIEDFALWNLPTELCDDWCKMEYFINILYDNKKIDCNIKNILVQINDNFKKCSKNELIHDSMRHSDFWAKQRRLAKEALQLMKRKKI